MGTYKISSLCPVQFHRIGSGDFAYNKIPSFEYSKGYNQVYFNGDIPIIQILSTTAADEIRIEFVDIDGDKIGIWTHWEFSSIGSYAGYRVYSLNFAIPDKSILAGICFMKMTITDSAGNAVFYSEPLYVCETMADVVAIVYNHDENDFDRLFTGAALPSMIRVEGGMKSEGLQPGGKFTMFQDMAYNSVMLNSQPYNVEKWTFGGSYGIPNWLADKINRVFGLSNVTIDNVQYSRNEGAKMERTGETDYPLAGWAIDLVKTDNPTSEDFTTTPIPVLPLTADNASGTADNDLGTADQTNI